MAKDKTLSDKLEDLAKAGVPKAVASARTNFVSMIKTLGGEEELQVKDVFSKSYKDSPRLRRLNVSYNKYANENKERLVNRLGKKHLGSMIMFMYDPKFKDKLPYYDRLPLILPMEFYNNGRMLGLNLHYLPPKLRAMLLDALVEGALKPKLIDENKRIKFSYAIMKRAAASGAFAPCVKKYIVNPNHVKSRFLVVPPEEWAETLFLPYERFEKQSTQSVFRDSVRKMRRR